MQRALLSSLIAWQHQKKRKPLILQGVRQVGKTYLLKYFGSTYFPRYHYINLEKETSAAQIFNQDFNPQRIINALNFHLDTSIDILHDLIIFDEIQACPKALTSLKYFQEDMPQLALCAAGSLLGVHLSSSPYPVGKVDLLKMYPLSYLEFLEGIGDEKSILFLQALNLQEPIPSVIHQHLWEQLKLYFIIGGLPEVVETYNEYKDDLYFALQQVRQKQTILLHAYYADIAKHSGKINTMHIDRIWRAIPTQLAQTQDGSANKFKFKGVIPGIDRYSRLVGGLDWLEAAGLVIRSYLLDTIKLPLSAYAKEGVFKLFLFDVGMLGAMSDLSPQFILNSNYGSYKGYFAENYVAQAFINDGQEHLYSWTSGTSELEFVREIDSNIIPIEVKSGHVTHAKSLHIYTQKYQPAYSIILSGKNVSMMPRDKIFHLPLYLADLLAIKIISNNK